MSVRQSVVKWFDAKKGYGFILHPDEPEEKSDVFVHYSSINSDQRFKTLRTGQVVEFELEDGPKGLHAQNVTAIGEVDEPIEESMSDGAAEDDVVIDPGFDSSESMSQPDNPFPGSF